MRLDFAPRRYLIAVGAIFAALIISISFSMTARANPTVTNVTGTAGASQVNLNWQPPASNAFPFTFNGQSYNSVFVGSNTYLTFGGGSRNYSALSASNPALPGVHVCSRDNSYQRVQYLLNTNTSPNQLRVRYEGNNATSGTVGSPSIIFEAVFYLNQSYFDLLIGSNSACSSGGLKTVTNGSTALANPAFAANTNWRINGSTVTQNGETSTWVGSSSSTTAANASGFTSIQEGNADDAYVEVPGGYVAPTGYAIRYSANGGTDWTQYTTNTATTVTSAAVTGLVPSTSYIFQVAPVTGGTTGAWSASSSTISTKGLPSSVTISTSALDPGGEWYGGVWYTSTTGVSNVTPTSLQSQLSSQNINLQSLGSITSSASVTSTSSFHLQLSCAGSGEFSNSSGAFDIGGNLSINCSSISTSAPLTTGGNLTLDNSTTTSTSAITVNANLIADTAGSSILLKSKSDIVTGNSVTMQTAGRTSGVGGNIVLWSDADASGEGYIQIGRNPVFNSVGGSTSTFSGGGDIHFGGGLDNGAATVVAGRASGDDLPDGWAVSSTTMGVWVGYLAASGDTIKMHSGGGKISIFGKSSGASDALAFNWTTQVDSGEGQIEIRGESGGWGIQLNRSGSNDTYNSKSYFTSRSDSHPAIYIKGKSSGNSGYMALLGSYGDAGTDNLVIQATGAGGIDLIADGPSNNPAMGLQSTAVLSASGKITIDGSTSATSGEGGIHFGSIYNGATQGSVQIGECATSTCANSLVTSSSADIDIIGNRVSTFGSLSTTIDTSGELAILPAVGSTAFTDFQSKTSGLTLDSQLGGLQIGREGDNTNAMRIANNWTIAGPIAIHGAQIYIDQDLETTDSATSPIRLRSLGQVYTGPSVDLVTNGSDVVFWSGANEAAGAANNTIYVSNGSTITTNGGKIWLAGGLDDGGTNALITPDRGKWSTVVADDGLPDGYASGENSANDWAHGVHIGSGSKLLSGGGDIFVAGSAGPTSSGYAHIALYPGAQIDSGSGRIAMWGRSFTGHTTQGIAMPWGDGGAPVMVTSNAASSDAISIYSDSSAGASWSRGIIAYWFGALDAARGYQGSQILATASGGGITMTGIGSAAGDTSDGPHGLYLDFIDIMAIDGPITLNGDGGSSGWSMGAAFGWRNNISAVIRLGGWAKGGTTANGGGVITTPGGVTADFTSSSSDVTINVDTFWNRQSSNGMYGVYVTTSGDFKILPAAMDSGLIVPSDNFRYSTQNSTDWSFEKLLFLATPESIQIGRPETTTAITVAAELRAHGAISVYGSALNFSNNVINESGRGPILLKSTSTVTLAANKTYETNGSDIVLWGGSAGGNGYILLDNGVCVNTNASCDPDIEVATGSIYMGGGSAGTTYPTGPVVDSGYRGIRFGTSGSGVKVLSGGGDISLKGQSNLHGIEFWQGVIVKATTGSITMEGTSTTAANQGFRIAAATGSTLISSGKTSGTAISISGSNTVPGTDLATSSTRGIYIADSTSQILATAGGDIVLNSSVGNTKEIYGAQFASATIESTGGDILYSGARFDLSSSTLRATDGGSIQIKSTGHITPGNSTIQTSGPFSGSGGEISIWSDSDGDDNGVIHTNGSMCINTIGSCTSPAASGGSKIVLGGGSTADSTGFFPAGGAPSSGSFMGIRLGSADVADQMKIWSGGGDISIRSKSATATNGISGQYWYGGTNVNSGDGAIIVENIVGSTSASIQSYGIDIRANSYPITVTSSKATGQAIRVVSQVGVGAEWSSAVLVHNGSNSIRTTFSATGGGDIYMEGTVAGTNTNTYSLDFSNTDILASTGNITLKGNRGTWWNRLGSGSSNVGALSTGAAEGDITIEGNRFVSSSTALPLNFKTTGTLTIKPIVGQSFIHDVSFPNTGINLSDLSGLTVGASGNTRSLTAATAANVAGPITYEGGAFTGSGALTNTGSGAVSILSSSTVALNANLSSGAGGILVKSVGRITGGSGTSAVAPRSFTTASGPITFWTTGSTGGIKVGNFTKLDTTISGTGADITLGGGLADSDDPNRPSGPSVDSGADGVLLGSGTPATDVVVLRAGSGNVSISGENTSTSAYSGIEVVPGLDIEANKIVMRGITGYNSTSNTAAGINFYYNNYANQISLHATGGFDTKSTAIDIYSESASIFAALLGSNPDATDAVVVKASGNNAGISIVGQSSYPSAEALWLAAFTIETKDGDVSIDTGAKALRLGSSTSRIFTYRPTTGNAGGDLNIRTAEIKTAGTGNISTAGTVSFVPYGTSFASAQTFPPASSTINVGGFVVGSTTNTANLTQGSAITSSGDVQYLGGAQVANYAITTSNSADIEFYPTSTFSKSTNLFDAAGDILIGKASSPATSATLSTSALTADGSVKVFSSGALTQSAQITAGDRVDLVSTTSDVLVNKGVSAGSGGIHIKANRDILLDTAAKNITTNAGDIIFWANASGTGGEVDTGSLDVIVDSNGGDIVIGGGADDGANGGAASDEVPDNFIKGWDSVSTARLRGTLISDAGNITVRSQHSANTSSSSLAALYLAPGAVISATSGDIRLYGIQNSGNTSSGNQYGLWLGSSSSAASKAVISSVSGDVYLSGDSSQSVRSNRRGIVLYGVDISAGRDITLVGNAPTGQSGIADVVAWVPSTLTATRNTLIQGPNTSYLEYMSIDSGASLKFEVGNLVGTNGLSATVTHTPLSITGTGTVVIEPYATSFISALSLQDIDLATTVSGLRIGKTGNTADLTVAGTDKSIAGPIELIGGNVNLNSGLTTSSGSISVKGTGNIIGSEGSLLSPRRIATSGGDITLHSDSDANGGYIHLKNFTTVSTGAGAGDILISGGLDPLTGFATTDSSSGTNTAGVNLVTSVDATVYGNGVVISAGTGDVNIRGKASGNSQGRGIHLPRSSSDANKSSISGANVTLTGKADGSGTWYGIEFGASSVQTSTVTTKTLLKATETLSLEGSSVNYDGITATYVELDANEISIIGTGPRQPVRLSATQTVVTAGDGGVIMTASKSGTPTADSVTFAPTSFTSSGPVEISFDRSTSSGQLVIPSTTTISTTNANVTLESDALEISGAISAGTGIVTISPATVGKVITAGTEVANTLSLTSTELGKITAGTLRLTTEGDVNVTSSLNFTNKVTNFAIRSGGNVTGSAGVVITVANLGIDATGNISFPGNQVATVIALSGAAITYNQSADYSVASVDGIYPEYGFGVKFAIADVPTIAAQDAFMNVAFNPPPVVTILDKFNNVLASNNLSAADFTVTPTLNSVSSTGTPVLAGGTPTRSGGTFTFDAVNVSGATGTHTLTFAVTTGTAPSTTNLPLNNSDVFTDQQVTTYTTGTYNVQAGEPASISIAYTSTSSQAGKTGFGLTATLKDTSGNTIATGPHATATISVSIAGTNGTIVSGDSPTTAAGVADFSDLILGGSVETDYTLTFSVTYTDTQSESQTVTETQVVTLTPGDATRLDVSPATQTKATGQVLSDITVSILDAYDNIVTSSGDAISIAMSEGSNGGSANLVGYSDPVAATSGQVVFNTLGINGTVGNYTLTFSSGSLTTDTHVATITHSVAHRLGLSIPTTAKNDVALSTDPIVTVYDVYDNIVESFVGDITLSVDSGSLSGTVSMDAVAGVADFDGKGVKLLGLSGTKSVTATAASLSNMSASENVSLTFGPAVALDVTTPAAGFVNRVNFATQPAVTVEDSSGNPVEDFVGSVQVSVSGTSAALDGTKTINLTVAELGVAEFSGLSLRGEVGSYSLSFEAINLTADSQSLELTHGAPTQVTIIQTAIGTRSGQVFDTPIALEIQDADGNVTDTGLGATAQIVVTKQEASFLLGGADFGGTSTVTANSGVATFGDLKLSGAVGDYNLSFAVSSPLALSGFTAATETITLAAGSKSTISIVEQPVDAEAGVAFSPVVTVEVLDAWGNRVLADSSSTISAQRVDLANVSVFETLQTETVASGLATFTGMNVETIGDFKIRFTSASVDPALSDQFTVRHGPASKLVFTTNPTSARSDVAFTSVLRLLDQYDNAVTTGPEFTITASVVSANNADVLSLTGNETTSSPGTEILIYSQMKLKAPTGTYQLRYTATDGTDTFSIDSNNIVLGYGNPAQLNIATEAATALAGEAFGTQPIIEIQDSAGNLVANSTLLVTASVPGKSLVGTEGVAAIGGIANFSSSGLGIAGTVSENLSVEYEIEYPAGNFITASHTIDLLAGPTRYLHILEQPTELVTRGTFSPGVEIQLRDQYQNPVLSDSTTSVSALLYGANDSVATATVGEPAIQAISAAAVSGVVDFSSLSYAVAPASGYYLKFSLPSNLDIVDSSSFTVVPGAVASISIDQQPSTTNLDNSLVKTGELLAAMPEVSLYDQDGYLADNASGSVSVSIASGNGGDLSEGATTAIINSGRAVFSGVKLVGTPLQGSVAAEQYELKFSFNGVDSASSDLLSVTHNVASKLILQRSASGGRAGEPFTQQPIIEVQDRYSNIVENSNAQIRAGASAGARITSGREVNAQSGIATFTSLGLGGLTTGTYQLTFEIPNTSVTNVAQSNITLTYGFADHLGITTAPASLDSNGDLTKTGSLLEVQPVVKVYDADNNVVESSNDIITVSYVSTFDDRDRLEGETLQAVNGVAAFQDLKLIARPGQNYTLNFTSGELGNTQSETLQVRHADPDSIEITTQPSAVIDIVNGILTRTGNALAVQPQIRILDFDGNHADSATGVNVVATVVSGGGTAVVALDASGRAFNEAEIIAGAAAFSELKLVATPGVAQEIAFSAAFPTGTISSVSSDQLTLTNGLAQSLAMHVEPCAGADDGVTCTPGVTGEALEVQPTVKVLDAYGNLVVDHVGDIVAAVTASGARLSVTDSDDVTLRTIAVAGGYANFSGLELTATPGTPVSIGFSSQGLAGVSSRDLVVGSAGAASIEMVVQPIGERTGNEFSTQPTIKLVDRFGNTVTGDSASVITVSASGGNLFLDPEAPLTALANQGVVSFTGLRFTGTPGAAYQLSFTGAGLTPATSADFSVTNAFANNLVITQQPTSGKTGDLLTQMPILELRDFDGNLAEDDNDTVVAVTIDVSNGAASFVDEQDQSLVTAPSATASAGVVEFEGLRIVATPGTVYKLKFEATPLVGETFSSAPSGELVFTHANPAQLVVTQSALGGLAGEDLPTQPIIEVQDRFGNRATGDSGTVVNATIETGTSGDVLRGASVSAVDGVVSFTELALDGVPDQTYTLRYSAVSVFGDEFYLVDSDELTLSRPAALTLTMEPIYFAPDQVVAPVFTNDSQGVVTWTTTTDATICVLELDGNNEPTGNVIIKGVGTCSLKAEVARFDFTHLAAPQSSYLANEISANLVINKAAQAPISMTSADNVNYRGSLTLASSGGSGTGAISYFVSGDCRVIGGVLLPGEAGANCVVFARKAGDANYERADSADQTITINKLQQEPLQIVSPRQVAVGDIELVVAGGSGPGFISFDDPLNPGTPSNPGSANCRVITGTDGKIYLRATQNGTCGVMATKQSSTNYLVAISPEVTFSFSKMTQVVNFTSVVPSRPLPGTLFTPTAVASSELAVTITISAGEGTVCEFDSVETSSIRFLTSGNCVLTATQAGSDRFTAASSTLTIAVNAMNQTITFPSLSNKVFGEPKFELSATSSSGLPVAYALGSTFQNLGCSVTSAGMVTLTAAGMCEIIASQSGDASYLPAPDVVQIFSVAPDLAGAPHLVSVAVSNQAITAKFRAPSYLGGSQVSAYRLEASNGEGDTYVNPGCSATGTDLVCDLVGMPLTRQVDGETVAISYTVRVAAVTAAGIGVYSDSSPSVIPRSTDFAVMQLSGDQIDGQLEVTWAEPLAFDGEFVSYEVFVWPLNTAEPDEPTQTISSVTTESASFEMEDAQPTISSFGFSAFTQNISIPTANAYNLKVVTVTDTLSDDLDDINVASGVQIGLGAPGRPRNEVIEADSQQLKIFWSQPNSDGGSEVTHYMIRKSGDAAAPCEAVDPSSAEASGIVDESWNYSLNQPSALLYEQSGLSAGSSYEIAVFACNEIGASQPAILTHSIPAPPSPPAPVVPEEEVDVEEENSGESEENGSESGSSSKPKPTTKPGSSSNPSPSDILNPGNETEVPTAPSENQTPGPVSPETQGPGVQDPETTDPESPEKPDAAGENPAGGIGNLMLLIWVVLLVILVLLVRFLRRKKESLES